MCFWLSVKNRDTGILSVWPFHQSLTRKILYSPNNQFTEITESVYIDKSFNYKKSYDSYMYIHIHIIVIYIYIYIIYDTY